jgi:hypothetical protein
VTTTRSLVDDQKAAAYPGDTRSRDLALSLSPIFLRAHNLDDVRKPWSVLRSGAFGVTS